MFLSVPAHAQLPLSVEQLMVPSNRWQTVLAVSQSSRTLGHPSLLQTSLVGTTTSLGLRYGVGEKLELNVQAVQSRQRTRQTFSGAAEQHSSGDSQIGVRLGANWLLRSEDRWPALLIEMRSPLLLQDQRERGLARSYGITLTSYKSIDPVVLSVSANTEILSNSGADAAANPSIAWRIQPRVNLALNPVVTLVAGLSYDYQPPVTDEENADTPSEHSVTLELGLGYAVSRNNTVFLTMQSSAERGQSSIALQWLRTF
ncbi:MAG: hypothetical protein Cons2KO_29410 [Congregibacter sp.]